MIDPDGFRPNVAMVIMNNEGRVFWAQRSNNDGWQFPQGGMNTDETPVEAMYRELQEETGLLPGHVEVVGKTDDWLRYRIPEHLLRRRSKPLCIGQKQIWFFLRLTGCESDFDLCCSDKPEFDCWRWVDYWDPVDEIVAFKRKVYKQALSQLERYA